MHMQIWMPYYDLEESARVLHPSHLKRSYFTARWLVKYTGRATGSANWAKHSAQRLIAQYGQNVDFLRKYRDILEYEWVSSRALPAHEIGKDYLYVIPYAWTQRPVANPRWFGNNYFHDSHKSALLALDYIYYGRMDWDVPLEIDLWWPETAEYKTRNAKL